LTRKFTTDHEWVDIEGQIATVGITRFAESQLGDIVFVSLPEIGKRFTKGECAAVVESVKAASDIYSPLTGEIVEINQLVSKNPSTVNREPESGAWFFRIRILDLSETTSLLNTATYSELIA
jgi:glycine cleavage system H protein